MPDMIPVQAYDGSLVTDHYFGKRGDHACYASRYRSGSPPVVDPLDLPGSLRVWSHSPAGWEWGYGGSGPAQLSLAILLDATGDGELATRYHQEFKWQFVAHFPLDSWQLTYRTVTGWITRQLALERCRRAAERGNESV